jgi:hypothetical protein
MKKVSLGAFAALFLTAGVAHASCSNGTIRGAYAFTVHGDLLSPDGATSTGRIDGVGMITFDGRGNFVQEDFVVRNGVQLPGGPSNDSGFHADESGTYSVNDDCTGTETLQLSPGNERTVAFVISKSARTIHGIVASAVINGNPSLTEVYVDLEKVDSRE